MFILDKPLAPQIGKVKIVVFASNGSLKKDGSNVMGKGIGHVLTSLLPTIANIFGRSIKQKGNHCYLLKFMNFTFISFPTKHNYWEEEDLDLIEKSIDELRQIIAILPKGEQIAIEYPLMSKAMHNEIITKLQAISEDVCIYLK